MKPTRVFGAGLAALAAATAIACGAGDDQSEAEKSFQPTLGPEKPAASKPPVATGKPVAAVPTITDGTWVVGEDIPPGTYKVNANVEAGCYWSITRSGSNGDDIVSNDIVNGGRPKVTIKKGQDFETADCGTWTKVG